MKWKASWRLNSWDCARIFISGLNPVWQLHTRIGSLCGMNNDWNGTQWITTDCHKIALFLTALSRQWLSSGFLVSSSHNTFLWKSPQSNCLLPISKNANTLMLYIISCISNWCNDKEVKKNGKGGQDGWTIWLKKLYCGWQILSLPYGSWF